MDHFKAAKLFGVEGMVFVITGGGSGLGEMMALALDTNGAKSVFILGRRVQSLQKVADKAINKSVIPVACDVTSKEALQAAVDVIKAKTPFVNAVVANSGILGPLTAVPPRPADVTLSAVQEALWATSLQESQSVMNVNTVAPFYTFVAFMGLLDAGNTHPDSRGKKDFIQSQFITTLSLASFSRKENVGFQYMASKAGLAHLTKSLATNFGPRGIRANAIAPGMFLTDMTDFVAQGADWSVPGSLPTEMVPMTRTGTSEDMAGAILFLTSRAGAFSNGNVVLVDGGSIGNEPGSY
ncbi:uncharacterized protein LTR77_003916 [Saxophila tyrrhenica]|uniref:Uncharacterized protein n=1 Tax=Saxophila tyrrhenica TaxID=1690608 RepID=A0AAV9PF69_9PEZI|nr:hypothetical protein LTR77_003916 [Saxophila tyrrhenica]